MRRQAQDKDKGKTSGRKSQDKHKISGRHIARQIQDKVTRQSYKTKLKPDGRRV